MAVGFLRRTSLQLVKDIRARAEVRLDSLSVMPVLMRVASNFYGKRLFWKNPKMTSTSHDQMAVRPPFELCEEDLGHIRD